MKDRQSVFYVDYLVLRHSSFRIHLINDDYFVLYTCIKKKKISMIYIYSLSLINTIESNLFTLDMRDFSHDKQINIPQATV